MRKKAAVAALLLWLVAYPVGAQVVVPASTPPAGTPRPGGYEAAQTVSIRFASANQENGLRLLSVFADGVTEAIGLGANDVRRTVPGSGSEHFFYLEIDDSYLYGGLNEVEVSVTYYDQGFAPVYLDYDATVRDPLTLQHVDARRQRINLGMRGNTEAWRTATATITDGRFAGGLGGADFRIGSPEELRLLAVAVWRKKTELPPAPVRVMLNDTEVRFTDALPFIAADRVLVPLRAIFEALGAQVAWYAETRTVEARRGPRLISLTVGSRAAQVDGRPVTLDVPSVIIADRTYVPLRFVAESFGNMVGWDPATYTVSILGSIAPGPSAQPEPSASGAPPAEPAVGGPATAEPQPGGEWGTGSPADEPAPGGGDSADECTGVPWWMQPATCFFRSPGP